jgi:hypothetical protein
MNGHYANAAGDDEGIPAPSPHDQDLMLEAWREALAEVLHIRDNEWKQQLRAIKAESAAAIAELRASAAEFRGMMEATIERRLAQIPAPAEGPPGEPGARGEPGPPGKIERLRAFIDGEVHYEGDVVLHMGGTYQARCDTARAPPHDNWACLATAGRDGRSVRVRGTYRAGDAYEALDIVALNGGSFIARRDSPGDCPGDCPGEGWQALTLPGKRGLQGERGLHGERGPQGQPGKSGPAIIGWEIDSENYAVCTVLSDQTRSTPLDLRGLFEQFLMERING